MSTAVQSVVAFDLAGSNRAVGFVILAQGISQLALGPFGGALADRVSKRLVIFVCQAVITAAFLMAAILIVTDTITIPLLALTSFAIGVAFSFLGPARQGLLVEFVGPGLRGNAVALSQVALNASRILAPFVAAAALGVGVIGPGGAYFGMTVLYLGAMACTYSLPKSAPTTARRPPVFGEIWSGIKYVGRTPGIRILVPSYILVIMCGFPYVSVLPGLVKNEFGRDPSQITWLLTVNAIGGLMTSLAVASMADSKRAPAVYTALCLLFGLALIATGLMPNYWLVFIPMFFVGAAGGGFQTLNGALVSHLVEPAYFGRVISLTFLAFASSSVVALPVGSIADAFGEAATISASGVVVCALVVVFEVAGRLADRRTLAP